MDNNINEILGIMKNSYNQFYERTQNLDNKSGLFIAFHSAILFLLIDIEKLNKIIDTPINNIRQICVLGGYLLLTLIIVFLVIISICLFIYSLKSRDIKYITASICDEKYYNSEKNDFSKELLKSYKEIEEFNEKVLEKKHKIYNIASILTVVEVILIGITQLIQIFL